MSKVNPVMKHKPRSPKDRISVEEFMETIPAVMVETDSGVLQDNSTDEWIETADATLDPIAESVVVADQLDQLAGDVDATTTAVGMESYRRIFNQLTTHTGLPRTEGVALESFKCTKGGKRELAKAIRDHAKLIRGCASVALEDFTDSIDESIGTTVSNYKQTVGELNAMRNEVSENDTPVNVKSKKLWDMWFIDNQPIKAAGITEELSAVDELTNVIGEAADRVVNAMSKTEGDKNRDMAKDVLGGIFGKDSESIIPKRKPIHLMFNTNVIFDGGRAKFVKEPIPEARGKWTAGDFGWIVAWGLIGGPIGAIGAAAYRGVKGGSGEKDHSRGDKSGEMRKFIEDVKKMAPMVDKIKRDVDDLTKAIKSAPADRQAAYKRAAAPVIELASKTIDHITEVTYGTKTLMAKLT